SIVPFVVPEIKVPTSAEVADPSAAADLHFIPLSRGMPRKGKTLSGRGRRKCSSFPSEVVGPAAFPLELLRVQLFQPGVGVHILGPLVVPDARDPGETEGKPAWIARAPLDLVVRHLHDDLRSNVESPSFLRGRQPTEP